MENIKNKEINDPTLVNKVSESNIDINDNDNDNDNDSISSIKTNDKINTPIKKKSSVGLGRKSPVGLGKKSPVGLEKKSPVGLEKNSSTIGPEDISDPIYGEYVKYVPEGCRLNKPPNDRPVRVYADGVFDLFHLGHMRQLEQAKKAFPNTTLVVGIPNDRETHKRKGLTVLNDKQRAETLKHCKWVDEVIENAPWCVTTDFLNQHNIDYVAHDDLPYADPNSSSQDIYMPIKKAGRFLATQRTEGISTSDIITKIIRDYDKYLMRNFARGATRQELNVSWFKKNELDLRKHVQDLRENLGRKSSLFVDEFKAYLSPHSKRLLGKHNRQNISQFSKNNDLDTSGDNNNNNNNNNNNTDPSDINTRPLKRIRRSSTSNLLSDQDSTPFNNNLSKSKSHSPRHAVLSAAFTSKNHSSLIANDSDKSYSEDNHDYSDDPNTFNDDDDEDDDDDDDIYNRNNSPNKFLFNPGSPASEIISDYVSRYTDGGFLGNVRKWVAKRKRKADELADNQSAFSDSSTNNDSDSDKEKEANEPESSHETDNLQHFSDKSKTENLEKVSTIKDSSVLS